MSKRFWCISVVFNPAGYASRTDNYSILKERLMDQNVQLLTIELAFNEQPFSIPLDENVKRLHSHSIMWQKERLINFALSSLPDSCDRFAWLDADLLLPDGWEDLLMEKLDSSHLVQLFQNVIHLKPGVREIDGDSFNASSGIVWQAKNYADKWITKRLNKTIPHAEPGFGWGARRSAFEMGLYDKLIIGSGDNFLCDCLLDSDAIHHYTTKLTDSMKEDMKKWRQNFLKKGTLSCDYLPINIFHLWHGSAKNRAYETRDVIFKKYDFNPLEDIELVNNVFEWSSNKPELHQTITDYFKNRKEDG